MILLEGCPPSCLEKGAGEGALAMKVNTHVHTTESVQFNGNIESPKFEMGTHSNLCISEEEWTEVVKVCI